MLKHSRLLLSPLSELSINPSINPLNDKLIGLTGGQIFHEMMKKHNVDVVFGYPGGAILPVFDAIYDSKQFNFILPRHEQGAGHMAEGYAKITGKPGVCLLTSGPGGTNAITAMQDAMSDGVPMVVFSGQVPTSAIGTDAFQEADIVGISRACTKWNIMIKDIAELPRRINEAFKIATSGRPGPVLIDLPKDITASKLNRPVNDLPSLPEEDFSLTQDTMDALREAARLLNSAKKPLLYVGGGILNSPQGPVLLKELAHKAQIPVTTTLMGLGSFDELDPLCLHMLGMHGSAYANLAVQSADVIVALGARFDDRVTGNLASKLQPYIAYN
jgi:acetolactate synthase-1/2/3 large subunit